MITRKQLVIIETSLMMTNRSFSQTKQLQVVQPRRRRIARLLLPARLTLHPVDDERPQLLRLDDSVLRTTDAVGLATLEAAQQRLGERPVSPFLALHRRLPDLRKLPNRAFGLPDERDYPMPDTRHAALAKGRARTELRQGNLTKAEFTKIVRKADGIQKRCGGTRR